MTISTYHSNIAPGIKISVSDDLEYKSVESALKKIKNTPTGFNLLFKIQQSTRDTKEVRILCVKNHTFTFPFLSMNQIKQFNITRNLYDSSHNRMAVLMAVKNSSGFPGEGSSSMIHYNINEFKIINTNTAKVNQKNEQENFLSLSRQLIHSYYILKGQWMNPTQVQSQPPDIYGYDYHDRISGKGLYKDLEFTENKIRAEVNAPLR